jgi:hypothetical protein
MASLPVLSGREVMKAFASFGWEVSLKVEATSL